MKFSLQSDPATPTPSPSPSPASAPPSPARATRRKLPNVAKLGIVAAVAVGAAAVAYVRVPGMRNLFAAQKAEVITAVVRPGRLSVIVKDRGILESAANKDSFCEVEGGTTIIRILPEGSRVKQGEVVCELDSAALRDAHTNQKITTQQAEASYKQASLTRIVAEYAVKEYKEGVYLQDLATAKGEIALAKSDQERAIDRVTWSTAMKKKGYVSEATRLADELTLARSKFDLEQAETQLFVLEKYTRDKQTKSLESDVEKAKADELSKQSSWELEKTKEAKLVRQIERTIIKAPGDGIVVYANDPGRPGGQTAPQVEEGASVRERQKIFSLPDTTKMRVNTKVHESMVKAIEPGLRALIRVEASAGQQIKGQVASVAPMADQNSFFNSDVKVYTTFVAIEGDTAALNLRPGMNAQVEILVTEKNDVLSVPVQAVLPFRGKDYVFVKDGEGFRREEVQLGISNDQHIEITKGIKDGDQVAMSPNLLLTEDERREAYSVASKDAAKKDFGGEGAAGKGAGAPGAGMPGAPGADGAAPKPKAKRGGGMGGMTGPLAEKFQKIPQEDRAKLRGASESERAEILKNAGFTDEEIEQFGQMRRGGGGGGGGRGGRGGNGGGNGGEGGEGGSGGPGN